ncbi:Short-chain dehydrogenase TIC 32, chloroplastic, partial [Orchesella cincta]
MKETAAKKNEPCQIIYTSSSSQRTACIDFDELETTAAKRYGESKLCFVVHAKTLQKKFRKEGINIHCYACHPGLVLTDLSPDDAASAILYPALTPGVVRGGVENTLTMENLHLRTNRRTSQKFRRDCGKGLWS